MHILSIMFAGRRRKACTMTLPSNPLELFCSATLKYMHIIPHNHSLPRKTCILENLLINCKTTNPARLMLEQPQRTLNDDVLKDGARWDVNRRALGRNDDDGALEGDATAEIDGAGDGEMVKLDNLGDRGDA